MEIRVESSCFESRQKEYVLKWCATLILASMLLLSFECYLLLVQSHSQIIFITLKFSATFLCNKVNDYRFFQSKYNEMQICALCLLGNSFTTTLFNFFKSVKLSKKKKKPEKQLLFFLFNLITLLNKKNYKRFKNRSYLFWKVKLKYKMKYDNIK